MHRIPVLWLQRPDTDDEGQNRVTDYRAMRFRLRDEWVAVDADQLILPITGIWRTSDDGVLQDLDEAGILKQYGGESLLNDLLLAETEPSKGTEWVLEYLPASGFGLQHATDWDPRADWLADELDRAD